MSSRESVRLCELSRTVLSSADVHPTDVNMKSEAHPLHLSCVSHCHVDKPDNLPLSSINTVLSIARPTPTFSLQSEVTCRQASAHPSISERDCRSIKMSRLSAYAQHLQIFLLIPDTLSHSTPITLGSRYKKKTCAIGHKLQKLFLFYIAP